MAKKKQGLAAPTDLSELDQLVAKQAAGVVIDVYNMDGRSPLGFGILIAGPDSDQATEARNTMQSEIQALLASGEVDDVDPAQREVVELNYLARISKEFIGKATLDKKPLENTEADFYKLYKRFRFIRLQIDRAHYDRSRFLPVSDDTSSTVSEDKSAVSDSAVPATESEPGTPSGV